MNRRAFLEAFEHNPPVARPPKKERPRVPVARKRMLVAFRLLRNVAAQPGAEVQTPESIHPAVAAASCDELLLAGWGDFDRWDIPADWKTRRPSFVNFEGLPDVWARDRTQKRASVRSVQESDTAA
jgi:hypothetical protein